MLFGKTKQNRENVSVWTPTTITNKESALNVPPSWTVSIVWARITALFAKSRTISALIQSKASVYAKPLSGSTKQSVCNARNQFQTVYNAVRTVINAQNAKAKIKNPTKTKASVYVSTTSTKIHKASVKTAINTIIVLNVTPRHPTNA